MRKVYVLIYYVEDSRGDDILRIAGVFDSKEVCEAFKRDGDLIFETMYFDEDSRLQTNIPPWNVKGPDYTIKTTCTGIGDN